MTNSDLVLIAWLESMRHAHGRQPIDRFAETQAFGRPLTTEEVDRAVERDRQIETGENDAE